MFHPATCKSVRAALLCVLVTATAAFADVPLPGTHPLLIPGKKTLYQRVLVRPGAKLYAEANTAAKVLREKVPPLSVFYVFERSTGEPLWLRIGGSSEKPADGWIEGAHAIDWKHAITLSMRDRTYRDRILFFKDEPTLESVLKNPARSQVVSDFRRALKEKRAAETPIIATEPDVAIDFNKQFYLLPVLNFKKVDLGSFEPKLLNVAAVPLQDAPPADPTDHLDKVDLKNMKAGVVFVIDTTKSMGPYIDRTREAVRRIYAEIAKTPWAGRVSFGLVGYRASIKNVPQLEYVTKVFADLTDGVSSDKFLAKVADVKEAQVSSGAFDEDPISGLSAAIHDVKGWEPYAARYLVLITDAGARGPAESASGLDLDRLRNDAAAHNMFIGVLHLKTPEGKANHAAAESQYKALTKAYSAIPDGAVAAFGAGIDSWTRAMASVLDEQVEKQGRAGTAPAPSPSPGTSDAGLAALSEMGHAMRLAYLGSQAGVQAPSLIDAWVSETDPAQPQVRQFDVRVLLTKRQLADLKQSVQAIIDSAEKRIETSDSFFDELRAVAAAASVDPKHPIKNLKDTGILGEYLDDLPYKSRVSGLTEDNWRQMEVPAHIAFIDSLRAKMRLYDNYDRSPQLWVSLDQVEHSEDVYAVPMDDLP